MLSTKVCTTRPAFERIASDVAINLQCVYDLTEERMDCKPRTQCLDCRLRAYFFTVDWIVMCASCLDGALQTLVMTFVMRMLSGL